ncbi:uncharacterized protein LAESUDRAFT_725711 [Laetiporus sulphureus 93-53]|uniref:BTB domain-containing protein n=1 Tax=Laetiporus sulphureus 93-53 TaxID=1314785 RepID=A0A165EAX5_9APHY|nr:uncharacterized protein LAESUDRAFT_725711 [Laetiporus sulphureus 93-53]KZT06623.1 hypothetical protein LAESUDRAFT_725711 [Laetiporus sulphureus 93-53]
MATASFASSPFRRPMADLTLISSDNAKFHVHQVILSKAPMFSMPQTAARTTMITACLLS